jgi:hypothetical protein
VSGRPLSIDEQVEYRDPLKPDDAPAETIDRGEVIVRTVRLGVPDYIACQAAGIHRSTLARWKAAASEAADLEDKQLTEKQARLRDFCDELTRAEAQSVGYAVAMVRQAMPKDWRAAVALIERRFPRDFSKRIEVQTDPVDRRAAGVDAELAGRAQETFLVASLPDDLEPEDFLPPIESAAPEEPTEASA